MSNRINLLGGAYEARSIIADAQRCVNLYPERNPKDAESPMTHYPTPGLKLQLVPNVAGVGRCLYTATNGSLYYVCGRAVIYIDSNFVQTTLGNLNANLTTPVKMVDNGNAIIIVDGTNAGFAINLVNNAFAQINDPDFLGGVNVDYLDTFFVLNEPGSRNFYASLSNVTFNDLTVTGTAFDPLYIAAKTGFPDKLATLIVVHREIWLFGIVKTTEVWYDAGGAQFPFQIIPGVFIEHGCAAAYSVAKHDLLTFWLGIDAEGLGTVYMGAGYAAKKISTPAIAYAINTYGDVSAAIGMMYKQADHVFYLLTFPTANKTWVYDLSEDLWHERAWLDPSTGIENRHRANCMALAYNLVLCADWENGRVYQLDLNTLLDNEGPILRRRSMPHIINDGNRMNYGKFVADMECGNGISGDPETMPEVSLRISDTRGRTWWNAPMQPLGAEGEYYVQPKWGQLGMARDRVFEIYWSSAAVTALNCAYIDVTPTVPPGT